MGYFGVTKYNDNLYQIKDALGSLITLVIGKKKALVFDTGYGIGDLVSEIRKITDKELIVVLSHGHMDHACGAYQFDKAYINDKDRDLFLLHNGKERRKANILTAEKMNVLPTNFDREDYLNKNSANLENINYYEKIDLGDLELEVIPMQGHTKGSIGLFIKDWKLMLVADATCPFVWLFLEESTTVKVYIDMLLEVLKLDFDNFLVGHGARMFPKSKMVDFYNIASSIDLEKSVKVSFNNFDNLESYCYTLGKMYDQNDCGIVFDPKRLK